MKATARRRIGLLLSFALLFPAIARTAETSPLFNVLDYGAHKDGSAPSTDAIRSAIQAAKAAGGGTVFIPAGNYITGPIELVSNLVLHVDAGAVLKFPAARLPYAQGRVQGIECLAPIPLIGGANLENVTIRGKGTVTTDNAEWVKLMGPPEARTANNPGSAFGPAWNHLRELLQQKMPQLQEEYLKAAPFLRPDFIRTTDSKNIVVEGIHIVGSSFWTIHMLYCQNVAVHDVAEETFPGIFTGGIYIDSCRDVRISDCNLDNGDDAIVLKAGKDADGLRVNRSTENVTITGCIVHRGSGAIVLGSETSGCIRNVVASNIVCQGTQMGINIKSERGRGGVVENVRIDNIAMDNVSRPITVTQFYQMQGEIPAGLEAVSNRTPIFRDIAISHVTINKSSGIIDFSWNPISTTSSSGEGPKPLLIDIAGLPEMPITGLRLSDIVVNGKAGLKASNTLGMELHNVQINPETGPAFVVRDSKELLLDGVSTRTPQTNSPVIRIERSPGAILQNCRAFVGTGNFLSVLPGELKDIILQNNSLNNAGQPKVESPSSTD
ncbi:MAG TPA: glycoside hydrolase family 28 protein [Tepidisphaeraceae bacterium]|nr:glycoside hydrolase family 28 protein [Tepidisphaeraceae bacterium]